MRNNKIKLSLVSPQKNVESFVSEFYSSIEWIKCFEDTIELIIIEDHSIDNTLNMLREKFKGFTNVIIKKNIGSGKVCALNQGVSIASGKYIRLIDGDDQCMIESLENINLMEKLKCEVCSSSYFIKLYGISVPNLSRFWKFSPFHPSIFKSPPRWNWIFEGSFLKNKVFPLNLDLPFEDLYMAIAIRNSAKKVISSRIIDYVYVQHNNQTFGGIHRSNTLLRQFRASRNLQALEIMEYDIRADVAVAKLKKTEEDCLLSNWNLRNIIYSNQLLFFLIFSLLQVFRTIYFFLNKRQPFFKIHKK